MELKQAQAFAIEMLEKHGLAAKGWIFKFDNAKARYGQCSYRRKHISLSRPLTLVNTDEQVRETVLHEIAHALTPDDPGHGRMWKLMAASLGARPIACGEGKGTVPGKYRGVCQDCGHEFPRWRRLSNNTHCLQVSTARAATSQTKARLSGTRATLG